MVDSKDVLEKVGKMGEAEETRKVKKLKFTPPVLQQYGKVTKICQAATVQGQNDFFTS